MSGGLGRAMGGYDEMVFRTMVRDNARIYDVVGLESEGTAADFQTGANSYLYGTRFMTWLCYTYGPDKLMEWVTRGDNTKRYFGSRFAQVYGMGMGEAWKKWIADEREWQESNLPGNSQISAYLCRTPFVESTRIGIALLLRFQAERDLRRDSLSGAHGQRRRDSPRYGKNRRAQGHQGTGALLRNLARLGSRRKEALLHHRQQRLARLERL